MQTITQTATCARCSSEYDPRYPAMSRVTDERDIPLCSTCGGDEAVGRGVVPREKWPLEALTWGPCPSWCEAHTAALPGIHLGSVAVGEMNVTIRSGDETVDGGNPHADLSGYDWANGQQLRDYAAALHRAAIVMERGPILADPGPDEDEVTTRCFYADGDDWRVEVYRIGDDPELHVDVQTDGVFSLATLREFGAAVMGADAFARTHQIRQWLIENFEAVLEIKNKYMEDDVTEDNIEGLMARLTPEDEMHLCSLAKSNEVLKGMLADDEGADCD